jgi:hypothetical protein
MTPTTSSGVVRRPWPRRMRTRLAVMYTVLFLLAGTVLLALTYALVANVLLPAPGVTSKTITPREGQLLGLCKQSELRGEPPMSAPLLADCKRAYDVTGAGPINQRNRTLDALRGASVIGLGVLAIASVGLGWLVSGRALRPVRSITEAARQASELRLGQRLALSGPDDELKELVLRVIS